jgi:hypothetical protein
MSPEQIAAWLRSAYPAMPPLNNSRPSARTRS